jgi:hypothetical protein
MPTAKSSAFSAVSWRSPSAPLTKGGGRRPGGFVLRATDLPCEAVPSSRRHCEEAPWADEAIQERFVTPPAARPYPVIARRPLADEAIQDRLASPPAPGVIWIASHPSGARNDDVPLVIAWRPHALSLRGGPWADEAIQERLLSASTGGAIWIARPWATPRGRTDCSPAVYAVHNPITYCRQAFSCASVPSPMVNTLHRLHQPLACLPALAAGPVLRVSIARQTLGVCHRSMVVSATRLR